jgi:SAM-dependent methyltransferase
MSSNLKETYNKIASDWNNDHLHDDWWYGGTDKFLSFLEPGASILDAGCGSGHKSKYFVDKGFDVTAIDFSEEMVNITKSQVPQVEAFIRDITKPLDLNKTFDAVFLQAVLLHIPKAQVLEVLKNVTSVLKSGGYFYVAVKENRPGESDERVVKEEDYGYEYERFFSFYTLPEIQGYIEALGFTEVFSDITNNSNTNWIQVLARKL